MCINRQNTRETGGKELSVSLYFLDGIKYNETITEAGRNASIFYYEETARWAFMARRKGAGRNAAKSAGKGIVNHAAGGMAGSAVKKASGGASRNRANSPAKNTAADAASMKANEHAYEIGELDHYLFGQGNHYEIYKKLGAHKVVNDKTEGVYFAVWAPNAKNVSVVGEFNDWNLERDRMERQEPLGIYVKFVPEAKEGQLYKFCIETQKGELLYKADPFANYAELRPGTASRITDLSRIRWTDDAWMKARKTWNHKKNPMSIYEVHMGSWMRHPGREDEGFYTYREFAEAIVKYVKEMGYTHVELMGIAEHPFDGSWGYQVTGYYAPTSRYGSPEDFAYLVDLLHKNNIGVILDWVPAHFPKDAHGLADFDGTPTFEYADPRLGEHPDWGTKVFDYGKAEVRNFLIANALFWIEHFHVDGLRVDAVASMLYLDYGKQDGQWVANKYGGNENLEAIDFFKHLNSVVLGRNKGAVMIAEESTAWPKVTGDVKNGGLGFDYKWNMGWMNDFLGYMEQDPYFRCHHYNELTFSMIYAYSENFVLVFSHDEVVHGKGSLVNKMPGQTFEDKFANLRAAYGFMMGHPGKKLLFMGQDFAQMDEWNENASIEWELLQYPIHSQMKEYVKELNHLYTSHPALYQKDYQTEGFEWINCMDAADNIIAFLRRGADETLLFVCNFAPQLHEKLTVGVPFKGKYKEIFNSDAEKFGGSGKVNPRMKSSKAEECDGKENSITIQLAPLGISVFNCTPTEPEKKEKPAKTKKTTHSTKSVKEKAETDLQSMMADAAAAFNGKAGGTAAAAAERLAGISDKLAEAKAGLSSKIISLSSIARRQAGLEEGLDKKVGKE